MAEKLVILVAEDDENDVFLLKRALKTAQIEASVQYVRDGQYAVNYLAGKGPYADREKHPLPHFAFFDIKMPRMTGLEALKWLRAKEEFAKMPVMIISSSDEERDIQTAHALGVSAYVVKPGQVEVLAAELKRFYNFWWPKIQQGDFRTAHETNPVHG